MKVRKTCCFKAGRTLTTSLINLFKKTFFIFNHFFNQITKAFSFAIDFVICNLFISKMNPLFMLFDDHFIQINAWVFVIKSKQL